MRKNIQQATIREEVTSLVVAFFLQVAIISSIPLESNGSVAIAKIPLNVMFMHQDYLNHSFTYHNVCRTNFDKDAFLNNYHNQLKDKLDVDKNMPKDSSLQADRAAIRFQRRRRHPTKCQSFHFKAA